MTVKKPTNVGVMGEGPPSRDRDSEQQRSSGPALPERDSKRVGPTRSGDFPQ
jgi:hypothetical protein